LRTVYKGSPQTVILLISARITAVIMSDWRPAQVLLFSFDGGGGFWWPWGLNSVSHLLGLLGRCSIA
jgi:hypothetical protein